MSLLISKTNTSPYDYVSQGDESNPISVSVTLDNAGGTITSSAVTAYLVATQYNYTGITAQPINEQTGINWQVSLDNATWAESVTPADMDGRTTDALTTVYLRAVVANDGTVATGNYIQADVQVNATENP